MSATAWQISGGELIARALLTLGLPLIYEGSAWFAAAKAGGPYYGLDEKVIYSQAYDPRAALVRCALIYALMFSILIAGEAGVFPNTFGAWVAIAVIMGLWIGYVLRSHVQQITAFAQKDGRPPVVAKDGQDVR
jgi:hypothetical protein